MVRANAVADMLNVCMHMYIPAMLATLYLKDCFPTCRTRLLLAVLHVHQEQTAGQRQETWIRPKLWQPGRSRRMYHFSYDVV
jgi:hypothetical protein